MLVQKSLQGIAHVTWKSNCADGRAAVQNKNYDLYLLDLSLPDGSGVDLCAEISSGNPSVCIFFLTSHCSLSEKVLGFSAGADDYIAKPFAPLELRARVESRFRKSDRKEDLTSYFCWKELEIMALTQEVTVKDEKKTYYPSLTALEFKLLMYFCNRVNEVITRDKILDDLWGRDVHVYPRSVDTHVCKLRRKLGSAGSLISSVHGMGYRFQPSQTFNQAGT